MTLPTVIVQARMGSSRLPGKVLAELAGRPMLWHVARRAGQARRVGRVVVATSDQPGDDPIAAFCQAEGIDCFRGSLDDVLDRYHQAARRFGARAVVRITADCPFCDPEVIDRVLARFLAGGCDYVSNVDPPTFPDGLDVEAFSAEALARAWREATLASQREHVTPYLRTRPDRFRLANVAHPEDLSAWRWTVDEAQDLALARAVFERLPAETFRMADVLALLEAAPELRALNAHIGRNEGYAASVRDDRVLEPRERKGT